MKLLFDQNLSPELARSLADVNPRSVHVRDVGLRDSGDSEIGDYAKLNSFTIVSKDLGIAGQSLSKIYCGNTRPPFTRLSRIRSSLT